MKISILLGMLLLTPRAQICNNIPVPQIRQPKDNSLYEDILSRAVMPQLDNSRSTNAHETIHFIHGQLAFNIKDVDYFIVYMGEGRGILLEIPKVEKKLAIQFLPLELKSTKLMYLEQYPNQKFSAIDELVAYTFGAKVFIEDYKKGIKSTEINKLKGVVELSAYCIAYYRAVRQYDPEYLQRNPHFKSMIYSIVDEALVTYLEGKGLGLSTKEIDNYCEHFLRNLQ